MSRVARLLVVIVALLGATTTGGARAVAADTATTTAVVVIDTGKSVHAITVDVGGGVSGLAALQRAASFTTAFNGQAVCSIDGFGNDATNATCLVGPDNEYWAYFHSRDGATAWTYSGSGAGSSIVHGGDVEGWHYGNAGKPPAASPVFCSYVTCAPPPATTVPTGGSGTTSAPAAGGSTGSATAGNGAAAASGGAGTAATAGSVDNGTPAPVDPQPSTSTTVPGADAADASGARRTGSGVRIEAAAAGTGGGPDTGSPVGVAIAAGILAIAAGSAIWLRRRSRVPG